MVDASSSLFHKSEAWLIIWKNSKSIFCVIIATSVLKLFKLQTNKFLTICLFLKYLQWINNNFCPGRECHVNINLIGWFALIPTTEFHHNS